ncbi:class I SAM-dependent methyltransferase [Gilvimarinus sp. F26214L]|uniref:class I SAM-dependent methyltransferase n=1 Tax=Gilvimarinus sp. DZF01 TaxID=3461371 RepID=UPI0040454056
MNDFCLPLLLDALHRSQGRTLWILDENLSAGDVHAVLPRPELYAATNRVDLFKTLRKRGLNCELDDFLFDFDRFSFDHIIYRVSKERALVHHCLNSAARLLKTDGTLLLIGQKNDGIKNYGRKAGEVLGSTPATRKHGTCYTALLHSHPTGTTLPCENYPELRKVQSTNLEFYSKPGIFGWNKIDRGSELLVEVLRENERAFNLRSRVLDLGCGWGYLLLTTRDLPFLERVATDNNVTALMAAGKNFADSALAVNIVPDDCAAEIPGPFELILCNPPFHQGFSVSEDLSRKFIQQTRRLLAPEGKALFVVNQFVPLERLAADHFAQVKLLAHQDGFKVFALAAS